MCFDTLAVPHGSQVMSNGQPQIPQWLPRYSDNQDSYTNPCPLMIALSHPLISRTTLNIEAEKKIELIPEKKSIFVDPLGATNTEDFGPNITKSDHLSFVDATSKRENVLTNTLEMRRTDQPTIDVNLPNFESWHKRRVSILEKFTTSEKLSISSSFLQVGGTVVRVGNKTAHRLEMLEDMSGLKKIAELSAQEYIQNVNELKETLIVAWINNKRVEAINLVIELARSLSSVPTPQFFPSQWVLVTDVLDLFGSLVYERILQTANEERRELGRSALSSNFSSDDILQRATEMAKNWFCKIADIKELIPRFYVETALISSIRFLDSSSLNVNLHRLASMSARINLPLPAVYARAYISKIAMYLEPMNKAPHWRVLNDWMQTYTPQNLEICLPAIEWIIQCVSYGAHTEDDLAPLWEYCRQADKRSLILPAFLNAVSPSYLANHALEAVKIVCTECVVENELYLLGRRLLLTETPENFRVGVLRSAWRSTARLPSVSGMVRCSVVWSDFAARFFSVNEINVICESLSRKLSVEKISDSYMPDLVQIIRNIIEHGNVDFIKLLQLQSFVGLLDLVRDEPYSSDCASSLIAAFVKKFKLGEAQDFRLANQIIEQCKRLTSSFNNLSSKEDKNRVGQLIQASLDRLDLSSDPERALSWLVQARACLCEIDSVVRHIVRLLVVLSMRIISDMRANAAKANLLRACIANLYITIPSFSDPVHKLNAALQSAHVSLMANSLPQTDAIVRMCLETLLDCPLSAAQWVAKVTHVLAFLVYVPDSLEKPPLFMFKALLNVIERRNWKDHGVEYGACLVHCLDYLWAVGRPEYPARFTHVASNDVLYGGCDEFTYAISILSSTILERILNVISHEDNTSVAMMLLEHLLMRTEYGSDQNLFALCASLLSRCSQDEDMKKRVHWIMHDLKENNSQENEQLLKRCGILL